MRSLFQIFDLNSVNHCFLLLNSEQNPEVCDATKAK